MRLLIASDLHGSLSSLHFLLARIADMRPDMIVLLGDLVYHGPRNPLPQGYDTISLLDEVRALLDFDIPITAVRGNCDAEVDVDLMPFAMPEYAWIDLGRQRIFACHGHHIPPHPPIAGIQPGTVVLRGHTHIPRASTEDGIHFWNPGSLSLPKGGYPRSFATYENGVFRVLDLQGGEIMKQELQDRLA